MDSPSAVEARKNLDQLPTLTTSEDGMFLLHPALDFVSGLLQVLKNNIRFKNYCLNDLFVNQCIFDQLLVKAKLVYIFHFQKFYKSNGTSLLTPTANLT